MLENRSRRRLCRLFIALACLASFAAAGNAAAAPGKAPRPAHERADAGTLLVKFEDSSDATAAVAAVGDKISGTTRNGVHVVRVAPGRSVTGRLASYRARGDVAYAEPNYVRTASLAAPNDASFVSQWALGAIDAVPGWTIYPGAFLGGPSPAIAVVDSGVAASHPDLAGRIRTSDGATCTISPYTCSASTAPDDHGHGTHVSGSAGASTNNGLGVAGVSYASPIVPVKVLDSAGSGTDAGVANGILWAVSKGVKVINLSLGGYGPYPTTLCNAVASATSAGVLVVAAAGNEGETTPAWPAACPGAIGVAATDSTDGSPDFSNWGSPNVFVSAPGVSITSTVMTGGYESWQGTSMAAPHVAALAALLFGQKPTRTPAQVKSIIAQTAKKVGADRYVGLSYGADPYGTCACTWHPYYGYGLIDVDAALGVEAITPTISTVSASTGAIGSTVTLTGTNFASASTVSLYGINTTFTFLSPTQISAQVPALPATITQGRWRVATPTGTAIHDALFTVTPASGMATISSVSPSSGAVGSTVTITGTNFGGVTGVSFYGINTTFTVASPTQITAQVPSGVAVGLQARWRVTNSAGTTLYNPLFTVTAAASISSVSPSSGAVGSTVTITGSGFSGVSAVTLYGINTTFTVVSPTQITASVPALPAGITQARWRVVTPGGTALYDPLFTVTGGPSIGSVSPSSGPVGSTVTITGSGFTGITSVSLYAINTTFTVVSPTQITAQVPALPTGVTQARWRVSNASTTVLYDPLFTVTGVASISSVSPSSGPVGATVTINGSGFTGVSAVSLYGINTTFTVVSPSQITAVVPALPAGITQARWRVVTPSGTALYNPLFTVTP